MTEKAPGKGHRASGLKLIELCPRRAWYEKREGFSSPSGKAAQFGTFIHKEYEHYFQGKKTERELHPLCQRGLATGLYPKPKAPGLLVEHRFEFTFEGEQYTGTIDLLRAAAVQPTVWDHKTSGNPDVWAIGGKNAPASPLEDVQGAMYIYYASLRARGKPVDALWIVHHSRLKSWAPRAVSSLQVTPADAKDAFVQLVHIRGKSATKMFQDARCAEDLDTNPASCHAFRQQCPAFDFCTVNRTEYLTQQFDGGTVATMGLLDALPEPKKVEEAPPPKSKKSAAQNHPKIPSAAKDLLEKLAADGPLSLSATSKAATERRPFVNRRTLDSLQQKGLLFFSEEEQGLRSVWLPHQTKPTEGYTPAAAHSLVNPPEISSMSLDEKERLSRNVLANSKTLGRQKAKAADLQSATDSTVRALLPAIRAMLDYAQSHGVDLLQELENDDAAKTTVS